MEPIQEDWYSQLQDWFMWSGVVCFVFIFTLQTEFCANLFGSVIYTIKIVNAILCWGCFIVGSRKTLNLAARILKPLENIRRGNRNDTTNEG